MAILKVATLEFILKYIFTLILHQDLFEFSILILQLYIQEVLKGPDHIQQHYT